MRSSTTRPRPRELGQGRAETLHLDTSPLRELRWPSSGRAEMCSRRSFSDRHAWILIGVVASSFVAGGEDMHATLPVADGHARAPRCPRAGRWFDRSDAASTCPCHADAHAGALPAPVLERPGTHCPHDVCWFVRTGVASTRPARARWVLHGRTSGPPGAAGRALSPAREERARAVTARHSLEHGRGA